MHGPAAQELLGDRSRSLFHLDLNLHIHLLLPQVLKVDICIVKSVPRLAVPRVSLMLRDKVFDCGVLYESYFGHQDGLIVE